MIFQSFVFPHGHLEVNLFLMGDEQTREAVLVDAGVFDSSVTDCADAMGLKVGTILITHLHADHVAGLAAYAAHWGAAVVSPARLDSAPEARIVKEGDTVQAGPFEFHVLKTSGHTPESISYHCPREGICFVGDALFAGSVGGTSEDKLYEEEIGHIRRNLLVLPPETELHSGHGPATTVAIEKAANPFLQPGFTRLAPSK
ncbi:MBL fold metallo-hydrolase [Candidatus Sumerlaeota bacterium]|nr:MBL fold metallo-hydrolase [Candidatus Sumerlaeota bacterium]